MAGFSRVDRNLLIRVGGLLRDEAEVVKRSHEPWTGEDGKRAKARYERLLRDATELQNFRRRLEAAHPEAVTMYPVVVQPGTKP